MTPKPSRDRTLQQTDPERYARLKAEAEAPYRGLRKFVYLGCAASGCLGGVVFLAQLLAGREVGTALSNLAVQVGVVALMVVLFRWENRAERQKRESKN